MTDMAASDPPRGDGGLDRGARPPETPAERAAFEGLSDPSTRGWIKVIGLANERACAASLLQEGHTSSDLNRFTPDAKNFPFVDLSTSTGFISCKTHGEIEAYRNDFQEMVTGRRRAAAKAATYLSVWEVGGVEHRQVLDSLEREDTYPSGLHGTPTKAQVLAFLIAHTDMYIPNDHVGPVRDFLRKDIRKFPENYGLPEEPPSDDTVEKLVNRVKESGVRFDDLLRWFEEIRGAAGTTPNEPGRSAAPNLREIPEEERVAAEGLAREGTREEIARDDLLAADENAAEGLAFTSVIDDYLELIAEVGDSHRAARARALRIWLWWVRKSVVPDLDGHVSPAFDRDYELYGWRETIEALKAGTLDAVVLWPITEPNQWAVFRAWCAQHVADVNDFYYEIVRNQGNPGAIRPTTGMPLTAATWEMQIPTWNGGQNFLWTSNVALTTIMQATLKRVAETTNEQLSELWEHRNDPVETTAAVRDPERPPPIDERWMRPRRRVKIYASTEVDHGIFRVNDQERLKLGVDAARLDFYQVDVPGIPDGYVAVVGSNFESYAAVLTASQGSPVVLVKERSVYDSAGQPEKPPLPPIDHTEPPGLFGQTFTTPIAPDRTGVAVESTHTSTGLPDEK